MEYIGGGSVDSDTDVKCEQLSAGSNSLHSSILSTAADFTGDASGSYAGDASSDGEDFGDGDLPDDVFQSGLFYPMSLDASGMPRRLCLVCSDVASGLHYGVASCEACKAFFKRTVQGNIEYSCPSNGMCEITKRRRKACQYCRYQKCLEVGMLREGVRIDRVRGGRQKYRRSTDGLVSYAVVSQSSQTVKKPFTNPPTGFDFSNSRDSKQTTKSDSLRILTALLAIEPEKVYATPDPQLPDDEYKRMVLMSDLSDRELVATIGWAKQVPGFLSLNLADQMMLLQSSWLDILCLNLVYRSSPYRGVLVYADDFQQSEQDLEQLGAPAHLDNAARQLAIKLTNLAVTREEYLLLKVIILLNPDTVSLRNPELVQRLRDRMHDTLLELERQQHVNGSSTVISGSVDLLADQRRVCSLLLLLPALTHLTLQARDYWQSVRASGRIVLHKLLGEMLDFLNTV